MEYKPSSSLEEDTGEMSEWRFIYESVRDGSMLEEVGEKN